MTTKVREATEEDVDTIVSFLADMQEEVQEIEIRPEITKASISRALKENVFWFLFIDENGQPFGTCHLQSVHAYWRTQKRYYLGGFYIAPSHRGQGRFREINKLLRTWVVDHDGVQIYAHIHKDNQKSLKAFETAGLESTEYLLCVNHWGD